MAGWVEPGWNTKKASIATQQSLGFKNTKEGFTDSQGDGHPNFRALTINTDRYCRIAGSLNPTSTDTAGREELLGVYKTGYSGQKGIDAIKKYLTDMYDRAIDSKKDANVSDANGGRQDSWNKCFGIPLNDPVHVTSDRFDTTYSIGSSDYEQIPLPIPPTPVVPNPPPRPPLPPTPIVPNPSAVPLPTTPGVLPVYCMAEVGVTGPKNPWKMLDAPKWEANAPPPGNGVFWMWGAADGYGSRPPNEAFSFYYNFNNPGPTITAKVAAGFDNYGYIVLNGTKYPSTNPHAAIGYEGFIYAITPFQVTIPSGPNTLEIRCVNAGFGPNASAPGNVYNPAGVWLAITDSKGNVFIKTNCDGWTCNKFFYPAESFYVGGREYTYNKETAAAKCAKFGATLATYNQLSADQKAGANWCATGFVADKGPKTAFYPITYDLILGCSYTAGIQEWIGNDQWFGPNNKPGFRAGANCFGNKPAENAWSKLAPLTASDNNPVVPFNKFKWSRYSTVAPPAPPPAPPVPPPPPPPPAPAASSPVLRSTYVRRLNIGGSDGIGIGYSEYGWDLEIPKEDGTYNCKAASEDGTQYFTFICTISGNISVRKIDAKLQDTKTMEMRLRGGGMGLFHLTIKAKTDNLRDVVIDRSGGIITLPSAAIPRDKVMYFVAGSAISLTDRKFSLTCTKA
jgi:hypothetical protein